MPSNVCCIRYNTTTQQITIFGLPLMTILAITKSRQGAWQHIRSRHHKIRQVFISDRNGLELVLLGTVDIETLQSKKSNHEFLVRINFAHADTFHPKIRRYQILLPVPRGQPSIFE